ncbi:uncharacterized protein LOC102673723 isoform X3 [Apis dorsata]|uniref:uncharacterized protein LOC102673723 isoform X3 n=1 Tax=Apis dorsata TaxID=7462 RepID=UPI001293357F|nr:uncharacterized protein LOC102673723 isoform X3 [Apis dorsata]
MKSAEARRLIKIFLLRAILCRRKRERRKSGDSKEEDNEIPVGENRCACCLRPLYLGRGVRCKDCGEKSCRKGCSRFDPSDNAWRCIFCRQQRNWLERHGSEAFGGSISQEDLRLYFNTAKSRVYVAGVENAATSSGQDLAAEKEEANTMETFRDFVEKIVVGLIGNMDVPINRVVYHHSPYGKLLEKHLVPLIDALASLAIVLQSTLENKSGTDVGTTAQALRDIVERVVEEAKRLPGLGSCDGRIQEERNGVENSYEEVLATTILNKVIEKYQKKEVDGNSNVLPGKIVPAKYASSESEAGLDEGVEEGCSSLEPLSQEDCASNYSASSSRRVRNQPESLSLTIEERIEEVTTTYASDEDSRESLLPVKNAHRVPFPELGMDIIDPFQSEDSQDEIDTPTNVDLVFPVESWEENWLFQKKKVQTQQADSVAMLVPNPSADYKALIGDKDAEDTSDLSECSSAQADEDIEKELMEAISNVVPRTPDEKKFGENDVLDQYPIVDSSKTDIRGLKDRRIDEDGERRGDEVEAKEIEVECRSKSVNEKPVPKAGNLNENGAKDETRNLINEESSIEFDCSIEGNELFADNLSNRSKPFAISTTDENLLDLPKTPTSTPRISMVELRELEGSDNLESIDSREKNVLNSLECAKKKLMAVNDVEEEVLDEEEAMFAQQKVDFHAEDIQEQESEYTEHYDIATQRHLDSLTKSEPSDFSPLIDSTMENEGSKCREAVASAKAESASHQSQQSKNSDEEVRLATPPRPGTIAEREHKKWENAPPIENNPYSRENIQKRLWERQYSRRSSENSGIYTELSTSNGTDLLDVLTSRESNMQRFGRDYYVNGSVNEKGRRSSDNPGIHNELAMSNGTDTDDMSSLRELNIQRNLGDYYDTKMNEKGRRSSDNPGNYELSTSSGSLNDVLTTFRDESVQRSAGDYYLYDQKASVNEKGRRSSDNPGSVEDNYEKNPKSSANKKERRSSDIIIDDVSIFQELNIQRFAGDCYTNDSKPSVNNKGRRSSGFSTSTSRPSSSLSQRSSFNGIADQDQQEEETQYKETESLLNRSNDVKSKVAKWQNNNVESKYLPAGQDDSSKGAEKGKEKFSSRTIEGQRSWEEQRMEEILENERKNSKNEINAKLNNQENTVIETKMFNSERNQRKIKRIDLKAYGFENEFCSNRTIRTSTPRVVNKLDLRSFGYDDGIRRTQSNIQLNTVDNDEFKVSRYTNLSQQKDYKDDSQDEIENRGSGDNSLTQSTETLNKFEDESYNEFKLRPAKSVPNITKCYSNRNSQREEEEEYDRNSFDEFEVIKTGSVRNLANNYNQKTVNIKSSQSSIDGSENDGDNSLERTQSHQSLNDMKKKSSSDEEFDNKVLPMPSVRRLAEVFSKQNEHVHVPVTKATKSCNMYNERSSTPEIQIVETPRQMHSLTARSLSKQFREGLRRIPNKVTSPPASHVVMEQCKGENQMEIVQPKNDVFNDTNVILPGKLKSNIIFWEQMQKKM